MADQRHRVSLLGLLRAGGGVRHPSLDGGLEGLAGAVPVEDVRHERETLPREVIAQVRARSPLAVNVRAGLEALGRVHGTGMLVHLVGRGELLARTAAPVAHPGPARVHVFVDGLGRIHRRDHLDRRAAAGAGGGSHRRVRGGSCGDDGSGCRS